MLHQKLAVSGVLIGMFVAGAHVRAECKVGCELLADRVAQNALATWADRAEGEPLGEHEAVVIPAVPAYGLVLRERREGRAPGAADRGLVYDNHRNVYTDIRIPDESSPPYWLADDIQLAIPVGGTEVEVTGYSYTTHASDGTAPYTVTSRLYRFDACVITPAPLVDWYTGDCCMDPEAISGTEGVFTIPQDGPVEIMFDLPVPVVVEKDLFMYLEYTGGNVAGSAGWVIAEESEVGFTDDFWAEEVEGTGCGLHDFGGDLYAGFAAAVWAEPAAVMDVIPEYASGAHLIVGNEMFLDCHDLPQCVQVAVYARDWDPDDAGVLVNGWDTRIGCESYETAPTGTLTALSGPCWPNACEPCSMCVDSTRADFIFPGEHLAGC